MWIKLVSDSADAAQAGSSWLEAATLVGLAQLIATTVLAVYVAQASRSLTLRQGEREVRSAWLDFDLGVLNEPPLLSTADLMLHRYGKASGLTDEGRLRWRWICYAVRNPLENFYDGMARRHRRFYRAPICADDAFESLVYCLDPLVRDDTFMWIVHHFSADLRFAELCRRIEGYELCEPPTRLRLRTQHRCTAVYKDLPSRTGPYQPPNWELPDALLTRSPRTDKAASVHYKYVI
jgi:hypothetical protein